MSVDPVVLKSEILTDPKALGFAPLVAVRNDVVIAGVLNFRRDGVAAFPANGIVGAAITVNRNDVALREVINAIAAADFSAATQIQISKLQLLFVGGLADLTLANVRTNFQNIFTVASVATTNALAALTGRSGSRAEQLFGTGTVITTGQVSSVLN